MEDLKPSTDAVPIGWIDKLLHYEVLNKARKWFVLIALIGFAIAISLAFAIRLGWVENNIAHPIVQNYFFGFYVAFSVVLVWEVMAMIYTIPYSIADSVGKQFEIMSLIIIRYLFEHIDKYMHIVDFRENVSELAQLSCVTIGALVIYFFTKVFYDVQPHTPITKDPTNRHNFIQIKKIFAVVLLLTLLIYAGFEAWENTSRLIKGSLGGDHLGHVFFKNMFSLMIFFDILMILLTMWYGARFSIVFRTSALTVSTVLLRIAFSSDIYVMVGITLMSVLFAIGVSWVYMRFDRVEVYRRKQDL